MIRNHAVEMTENKVLCSNCALEFIITVSVVPGRGGTFPLVYSFRAVTSAAALPSSWLNEKATPNSPVPINS